MSDAPGTDEGKRRERPLQAQRQPPPGWWYASDGNWYPPELRAASNKPAIRIDLSVGSWLALAGAVAVLAGGLMPWATVQIFGVSISKAGYEGDGVLTMAGGVGVILLVLWDPDRQLRIVPVVTAVAIVGVAVYEIMDVMGRAYASVGQGLLLTLAGGVVAGAGGVQRLLEQRRS